MTRAMGAALPFQSSGEHLAAEMARVELLWRVHELSTQSAPDAQKATAEERLYALLDGPGRGDPSPAVAAARAEAERLAAAIELRVAASERAAVPLRLRILAKRCKLDCVDVDVLLLALVADLDARERFSVLTAGLLPEVLCPALEARFAFRKRLGPGAPLLRCRLVQLAGEAGEPLARQRVVIDPHIAVWLAGDDAVDARLTPWVEAISPSRRLEDLLFPAELKDRLSRVIGAGAAPIVYLQGARGVGKRALVEALCAQVRLELVRVDCAALLAHGEEHFVRAVPLATREALLRGAALHWAGAGRIFEGGGASARATLLQACAEQRRPCFISGEGRWDAADALSGRRPLQVFVSRPSAVEQAQLWDLELGASRSSDVDLALLTSMFRLTGGEIREAAGVAREAARFRAGGERTIAMSDLREACRGLHGSRLHRLARPIPPCHSWEDLVLPPDRKATLREICAQVKNRNRVLGQWGFDRKLSLGKGVSALFSGPPGTGKTMAASVIAGELGLELFHVDLSAVVSKYVGETEKQLADVFAAAEATNAALFFDEADALFGKRMEVHDAHDRYANQETSYLLQRVEAHEGVVLLASNLLKNIDGAFLRRLGFVVEFPFPSAAERLRIWRGIWTEETPRERDLDLEFLADRVELSGGHIRNVALAAAFLAAEDGSKVSMRHVLHATRREFQKMGKVVDLGSLAWHR